MPQQITGPAGLRLEQALRDVYSRRHEANVREQEPALQDFVRATLGLAMEGHRDPCVRLKATRALDELKRILQRVSLDDDNWRSVFRGRVGKNYRPRRAAKLPPEHSSVAWIWPFVPVITEFRRAMRFPKGAAIRSLDWGVRLAESAFIALVTRPGKLMFDPLVGFAGEVLQPIALKRELSEEERRDLALEVVAAIGNRGKSAARYIARAESEQQSMENVRAYAAKSILRVGADLLAKGAGPIHPSTRRRWKSEGKDVKTLDQMIEVQNQNRARQRHQPETGLSLAQVARDIGRSRSVVKKAYDKCVAAGRINPERTPGGTIAVPLAAIQHIRKALPERRGRPEEDDPEP